MDNKTNCNDDIINCLYFIAVMIILLMIIISYCLKSVICQEKLETVIRRRIDITMKYGTRRRLTLVTNQGRIQGGCPPPPHKIVKNCFFGVKS